MGDLKKGCLHIYCGDGKGKTTAAVGLAVRAAGHGMKVLFCQCMKDGSSSEVEMLKKLGICYCCCTEKFGFYWNMTEEQKERAAHAYTHLFESVTRRAEEEKFDLLVIDEIGVQTESKYEKVIINQIVDRRSSSKRPTGMLTNSNMEEMTKLLGERVMDRMRLGNSL